MKIDYSEKRLHRKLERHKRIVDRCNERIERLHALKEGMISKGYAFENIQKRIDYLTEKMNYYLNLY